MSEQGNEREYVKGPRLSETEMQKRVESMRGAVSQKLDKWSSRVVVSMAISQQVERVEGERWVDDGKTWIIKDGIKRSVSFLDGARMPWWCPKCTKPMNHRFDRKFYFLRGWCYDCNVEWEGQLRVEGKWAEFEARMVRENERAFLRDKIQEHMEYMRTFKEPQIHFSDGRWEKLATIDMFQEMFGELERDIEFMLSRLEQIQREEDVKNVEANT